MTVTSAFPFIILLIIGLIFFFDLNRLRGLSPIDEGQWLFYVKQLFDGKILFRDIWYQYGPALLLGLKWSMAVFGKTLAVERIYFWCLSAAGLLALYVFSSSIIKNRIIRLALCLIVLLNSLTSRLTMDNPAFIFRECFNLLPLYLIFKYYDTDKKQAIFLAGALAVLSLLVSQETAIFMLAATAVYAAIKYFDAKNMPLFLRNIASFSAGFVAVLLAWMLYCLMNGCLKEYFTNNFLDIFSLATGKQYNVPFPDISYLVDNRADLRAYYHVFLVYAPFIAAIMAITAAIKSNYRKHAEIIALAAYCLFTSSILLGRCDIFHSSFASFMFFIIISYRLDRNLPEEKVNYGALIPALLFFTLILLFNYGNIKLMLHYYQAGRDNVYSGELPSVGSARIPVTQYNAILYAKRHIEANSRPEENFFVLMNSPYYYFFIDRPTSTRFATPVFANSGSAQSSILKDLKENNYRYIIYDRTDIYPDIDYKYYCSAICDYSNAEYMFDASIGENVYIFRKKL